MFQYFGEQTMPRFLSTESDVSTISGHQQKLLSSYIGCRQCARLLEKKGKIQLFHFVRKISIKELRSNCFEWKQKLDISSISLQTHVWHILHTKKTAAMEKNLYSFPAKFIFQV